MACGEAKEKTTRNFSLTSNLTGIFIPTRQNYLAASISNIPIGNVI